MAQGRLDEAAEAMEGRLISGEPSSLWRGAALDSRRVRGGELFFALPGKRTDGHLFVSDALARGAAAAVVERQPEGPVEGGLIRVANSFEALHRLTTAVRARLPRKLVAVTGSTGKTTTKELLAAMLAHRFRVARSPGNLNNLYGFPVALLGIPEETEWMVAEMGMSVPGELGRISRLGRPDVAVFTNVRPVHLEFFDSVAAIAEAKAELLEGLAPGGLVVANAADPEVVRIASRHRGRVVWFGAGPDATFRARDPRPLEPAGSGSRFRFEFPGGDLEVRLGLHGRFNVENFLAAAACAHTLGVEAEAIGAAASAARPAGMRGEVHRLPAGILIIDDSYNSNPDALSRVLASARELPAKRRWAVLGSMLELGPESPRFHRRAGEEAAELGFSPLIGVGEEARELVAGAAAGGAEARWFADAEAAAAGGLELAPGDLVLVKGSRGVGLERVVSELLRQGEEG